MIATSPKNWRSGAVSGLSILAALVIMTGCKPKAQAPVPPPVQKEQSQTKGINLLERYPTSLTAGDTTPGRARTWQFTPEDIFAVSGFTLEVGKQLRVETGAADLGIGHCTDGAVWAVLIPSEDGKLTSTAATSQESIVNVWLRFHPAQIGRIFPPETVTGAGSAHSEERIRAVVEAKFRSSWHDGNDAMIPEPKDMTVDLDTKDGPRRFFMVDKNAQTAEYVAAFARQRARSAITVRTGGTGAKAAAPNMASLQETFDKLWGSFDRDYAMFTLRPEVDWNASRSRFRSLAVTARSTDEFAGICAEMLRPLRDLHIWLKVGERNVPVFNRPRAANSNPQAHEGILGHLNNPGQPVQWAITTNGIGFLAIYGWNDRGIPEQCDELLEKMRATIALIVDVRLNGGGSDTLAAQVAARFIGKPFVYAYDQSRNGPNHGDLTGKNARVIQPRGPWRYARPVILLIGQKCMSSNESFIAMMSGDPNLITMGDHTCGSSGNPEIINLPLDMTVSVPRWIDYLPDGSLLDERGFQPKFPFAPKPGAFEGERDDLLTAALERLGS
ncbi:MAG: S41 family peptidase [Limisphaerales bacterium]